MQRMPKSQLDFGLCVLFLNLCFPNGFSQVVCLAVIQCRKLMNCVAFS